MRVASILSRELIAAIAAQARLPLSGVHGIAHWARVYENGLRLAGQNGACLPIVELFAVLHDACRVQDGPDPGHGRRGAELARSLHGTYFSLPAEELEVLCYACVYHTDGLLEADVTVQTCWDADRLDLGRVGITPRPQRLCTAAARDPAVLSWANDRATRRLVPALIAAGWT